MFKKIKKILLTILGDIKVYKFPFFMVYSPDTYRIKGSHTRIAMSILRPGDLVLRKYVHYLDGFFIPGSYSHTGIYVGEGKVIHAIAEGVSEIDIIDFLRCDGFCVLRQENEEYAEEAIKYVKTVMRNNGQYDFDFESNNGKWYCHELGAMAYSKMDIQKKETRILGFKLKPRYLAESFLEDERWKMMLNA